jgi:hypothetical protein
VARSYPSASSRQAVFRLPSRVYWRPRRRVRASAASAARADYAFFDGFESGTAAAWSTAANVTITSAAARTGAYGARLDSTSAASRLRLDTSAFSTGRRWAAIRCWVRFPVGATTEDVALVRWRNTDPSSAGGGGNGDIWLDSADQTLRGDLQPTDFFLGPVIAANTWYQLSAVCGFVADGTSRMKIRLDGVEIADVASTINDPGQTLSFIEFGSGSAQADRLDVDSVTIAVSDSELDYLDGFPLGTLAGTAPAAQGAFAGDIWVAGQLAGVAPAAEGAFQGGAQVAGTLTGIAPAATGAFTGSVAGASGVLDGTAPAAIGAFSGALTVTGDLAGQALAAEGSFVGAVAGASGVLAGVAPAAVGDFTGAVVVQGVLGGQAPAAEGEFSGEAEAAGGVLNGTAPAALGQFAGGVQVSGALAGAAPAAVAALDGAVVVRGSFAGTAPAAAGSLAGQIITPIGVLAGVAPAPVGEFSGISYAVVAAPARLSSGSAAAVALSSSSEQIAVLTGGTA